MSPGGMYTDPTTVHILPTIHYLCNVVYSKFCKVFNCQSIQHCITWAVLAKRTLIDASLKVCMLHPCTWTRATSGMSLPCHTIIIISKFCKVFICQSIQRCITWAVLVKRTLIDASLKVCIFVCYLPFSSNCCSPVAPKLFLTVLSPFHTLNAGMTENRNSIRKARQSICSKVHDSLYWQTWYHRYISEAVEILVLTVADIHMFI